MNKIIRDSKPIPSTAEGLKEKTNESIKEELQVNKAKTTEVDKAKRDLLHTRGRFTTDINKISAEDRFVINDVVLEIPPIAIHIDKSNVHHRWHTLRSKHPSKVKSGHGDLSVSLSIYFVRTEAINTGLRRLVAQLEHTPFVYVENGYLRSVINPGSVENMAFTVLDFTVRTEPGLVDALVLDLDMKWFNYKAFSPDFKYRKHWRAAGSEEQYKLFNGQLKKITENEDVTLSKLKTTNVLPLSHISVEVSDPVARKEEERLDSSIHYIKRKNSLLQLSPAVKSPAESIPYRVFYDQIHFSRSSILPVGIKNTGALDSQPVLQQSLTFTYFEYKQVDLPIGLKFLEKRQLDKSKLRDVKMEHIIAGSARMMMRPKAAADLEFLARAFFEAKGKKLRIRSCFRTYEEQAALHSGNPRLANKEGTSSHEGGLAIDVVTTPPEGVSNKDGTYMTVEEYQYFKNLAQINSFKVEKNERWHFTHQEGISIDKAIKELYAESDEISKQRLAGSRTEYRKWLKQQTGSGWQQVRGYPRIFRKNRSFSLSSSNEMASPPGNKMVMSSLAISMNNVIASLPVVAYQYATHQYMGSTDKDIFISMLAHGTEQISQLQLMNNVLEENARLFRKVPASSTVQLSANNIVRFMGITDAIVESITVDTTEGNPDLFSVDLKMTEWSHLDEEFLTEFVGDEDLRNDIIKRLVTQVKKEVHAVQKKKRFLLDFEEWKVPEGIREANYVKIPTRIGQMDVSKKSHSFLFEKNGILDQLITIIKTLNGNLYSKIIGERFGCQTTDRLNKIRGSELKAKDYNLPYGYNLPLFGAETLVHPHRSPPAIGKHVGHQYSLGGKLPDMEKLDRNQRKAIIKTRQELATLADEVLADYFLEDNFFKDIRLKTVSKGTLINGRPAYPDILMPLHPATNNILDTDPDWYFFNRSEDQETPEAVIQSDAADLGCKFASTSHSSYSKINDGTFHNTVYQSPNSTVAIEEKDRFMLRADGYIDPSDTDKVAKNIKIGGTSIISETEKIGKLGVFKNKHKGILPKDMTSMSFGANTENKDIKEGGIHDLSNSDLGLNKTYKESLLNMSNNQNTMRRAFPTFKIYFIDNETIAGDRTSSSNRMVRGFDDFYSYSAIKDIRIIRSRKIAADLTVITMTNVAGLLDGKSFYKGKSQRKVKQNKAGPYNPDIRNEQSEGNPWEGIILKEGQKIQVRMGYSNNPNELETVFNGQVVEIGPTESGDMVQIVCQSYGVELVQQIKGLDVQPDSIGNARNIGDTQELLSTLICEPELVHFGRWSKNPSYSPAEIQLGSTTAAWEFDRSIAGNLLQKGWDAAREAATQKWQILNKPQDDNIFAPAQGSWYDIWTKILETNTLDYYIVHTTIWDVFKEMELRHPGWITYPVPFEDRYTMFFGIPSQQYWSRTADMAEKYGNKKLQIEREKATKRKRASQQWLIDRATTNIYNDKADFSIMKPTSTELTQAKRMAGDQKSLQQSFALQSARIAGDRFTPFRRYHMLTSEHNIIMNSITTDIKNSINAISLEYRTSSTIDSLDNFSDNSKVLSIKADDNIEDYNTRVFHAAYLNCEERYMARNYALGLLLRHMKDMYTGELCIIGDPRIKPHDVCYVMDAYSDMFGQIGVEQVTHIMSFQDGFITKIVPDLMVTGNEWYNMPISDAISTIIAPIYNKLGLAWDGATKTSAALGTVGALATLGLGLTVAPVTFTIGAALIGIGGFKLFNFTQERQPICITPLLLHGIPYVTGLTGFKHQNVWSYLNGSLKDWVTGKEDGTFLDFQDQLSIQWSTFKNNWEINLFDIVNSIVGK